MKARLLFAAVIVILLTSVTFFIYQKPKTTIVIPHQVDESENVLKQSDYDTNEKLRVEWQGYSFVPLYGSKYYLLQQKDGVNTPLITIDKHLGSIEYMYIYHDHLFVLISDYLSPSYVFYFDTPESEPINILGEDMGATELARAGDKLILIDAFGDACYYKANYYLYNENTNQFDFRVSSSGGCEPGSEVVGIYEENVVMSDHDHIKTPSENTLIMGNQKYTNIYLISLDSGEKTVLQNNLPENITFILDYGNGTLYLSDNEDREYTYDIAANVISSL